MTGLLEREVGWLGEDVDAVAVCGDHSLQAGDLASDAVEPAGERWGVMRHGAPFDRYVMVYPWGVYGKGTDKVKA